MNLTLSNKITEQQSTETEINSAEVYNEPQVRAVVSHNCNCGKCTTTTTNIHNNIILETADYYCHHPPETDQRT